ncbi:MAG: 16S rRNA (cytosine(1402)-N(4))-methyltransferase RsmH [Robiginitomaculum sp.]|nr:16S rRNA (cytosine(1402)-N(4))-methyltransferase RsmH [Robiginitomaculum sp.]
MSHVPVLMDEVLTALAPMDGEKYIDATFGAGGYSHAILNEANCHVTGLDRDPNVEPHVKALRCKFPDRFSFVNIEFSEMEAAVNNHKQDGVVLDVGVSSMQIDQGERGFSFMKDGPLDMRMSTQGVCAADVIKHCEHKELVEIFKVYGEERHAKRCAEYIIRARVISPITTTETLAKIMESALGRSGKNHPATRVFQALRIYVNDELGELYNALLAAERILKPGGRLVVVSFHSLEDRLVKSFLRIRIGDIASVSRHVPVQVQDEIAASFTLIKRSTVKARKSEIESNPRSRSARLRTGIRTSAVVWCAGNLAVGNAALKTAPSLEALAARIT